MYSINFFNKNIVYIYVVLFSFNIFNICKNVILYYENKVQFLINNNNNNSINNNNNCYWYFITPENYVIRNSKDFEKSIRALE